MSTVVKPAPPHKWQEDQQNGSRQNLEFPITRSSMAGLAALDSYVRPVINRLLPWIVRCCFAFYLALAAFSAANHNLWFDEMNTALLSHLSPVQLWASLQAGADTNPPLLYFPVGLAYSLTSSEELATRLPSLAEFLLMMASVYFILRRYVGSLYALAGAFFPFLTIAALYATEGRGYAAMLGFSAAALLLWRNACLNLRRLSCLVGLALALALAVSNHYSATIILLAISVGEAVRTFQRRQLDPSVWIALALGGGLPLLVFRPLLPAIHTYLLSYWAKPSVQEIFGSLVLGWRWAGLLLVLFLIVIWLQSRLPMLKTTPETASRRVPLYELMAWAALLCSPIIGYLQGKITGGFTMRYALVMAIPVAISAGLLAYRAFLGRTIPGLLLLFVCLAFLTERMLIPIYRPSPFERQASWIEKETQHLSGPVMVGDPVVFSPMYHYASGAFKTRLRFVADPALSTRYLGSNSGDLNLQLLSHFAALPVSDYASTTATWRHFYVAEDASSWLVQKLRDDHAIVRKVACQGDWCLQEVHLAAGALP